MIWAGSDFFAWMRLLIRNRFDIHWSCLHVALYVIVVSFCHTVLRWVQRLIFGRRIARTKISRGADLHHRPLADRHHAVCTSSWLSTNGTPFPTPTSAWSPIIFC